MTTPLAHAGLPVPERIGDDQLAPATAAHATPRVLVFLRTWSLAIPEQRAVVASLRSQLAEVEAELVVLTDHGVWSLRPHDDAPRFSDELAADVATAAMLYGVTGDAVFVVDGRGGVRFAHRSGESGHDAIASSLIQAVGAACDEMARRKHHGKLERVRYTRREWALHSLVVGCQSVFGNAPAPSASGSSPRLALPGAAIPVPVAPELAVGSAPIALAHLKASK